MGNGDYFVIIASPSHNLLLQEHAVEVNIKNERFTVVCSRLFSETIAHRRLAVCRLPFRTRCLSVKLPVDTHRAGSHDFNYEVKQQKRPYITCNYNLYGLNQVLRRFTSVGEVQNKSEGVKNM